jgi:hypothetical protein
MTPRPEAVAAADWWAARLHEPASRHPTDDEDTSRMLMVLDALREGRHPQQVDAFRQHLAARTEEHLSRWCWDPADPLRAAELRALRFEFDPDGVLAGAAQDTGITLGLGDLPVKTVMYIDPGCVSVASAYRAERITVWGSARCRSN